MNIVAVDPSIRSLGIAFLETGRVHQVGDISLTAKGDYTSRAAQIAETVVAVALACELPLQALVIETPEHWAVSTRGQKSEDAEGVQRVYWCVGAIVGMFLARRIVKEVWVVRPNAWKGSVPKDIMVARSTRILVTEGISEFTCTTMPHDAHEALLLAKYAYTKYLSGVLDPMSRIRTDCNTAHINIHSPRNRQ